MIEETTSNPATVNYSKVENILGSDYERYKALFLGTGVVYLCIAVMAVIGNGLVLYAAYGNRNTGRLRHIDGVVKSLAVADMLFGLIGVPCKLTSDYYVGKYNRNFKI